MTVVGESRITNMILRMMGEESRNAVSSYVDEVCSRDFLVTNSMEQVNNIFGKSLDDFFTSLTEEELMDLRTWTSYNFTNINAILRNNLTYEKNGNLTDEKRKELKALAFRISKIFSKYNSPQVNFITFRGTTIDSFRDYGITSLLELESLEGKFLYEQGFTSASMMESSSYFKRDFNDGKKYNIEVRYLVSSESEDGVLLVNRDTSHYSDECEYLIDKGSLSKVIDVKVDKESDTAIMTVILIPKKVYDRDYQQEKSNSNVN